MSADDRSWLTRLVQIEDFRKIADQRLSMRLNRRLWNNLPASVTALCPVRSYGNFLHTLARIQGVRGQAFSHVFSSKSAELELIRRLVERSTKTDTLRVAVLGCSTGAEAYSVAWRIRSARPDLKLILHAVDISQQAVEVGKAACTHSSGSQFAGQIFLKG